MVGEIAVVFPLAIEGIAAVVAVKGGDVVAIAMAVVVAAARIDAMDPVVAALRTAW